MKLTGRQQQIVDDIIDEAHREHEGVTSEVTAGIIQRLQDLEGSGEPWVSAYIDSLAEVGAGRGYADWRRRHEIPGKTKAGTEITVPAFGGVTRKAEDGSVVYVQLALPGMTLGELRDLRNRKAAMRNTLSGEIKVYDALIDLMVEHDLATAGEALALMGEAA